MWSWLVCTVWYHRIWASIIHLQDFPPGLLDWLFGLLWRNKLKDKVIIGCKCHVMTKRRWLMRHFRLFGVIRIPGHIVPHLIIAFYFFLMPDLSLIIHLITAGIAYSCKWKHWLDEKECHSWYVYPDAKNKLPPRLVPTEDTYRHYEQNPWLGRAVNHGRFISVDNTSAYLPIANTSSQHLSADTTTTTPSSSSYTPFSGQGQRLGDAWTK